MEILEKHFWNKVKFSEDKKSCWEWQGGFSTHGYGTFSVFGKNTTAPRAAWFLLTGQFPFPYLCHKCDNKKCVRPSHLVECTPSENNMDIYLRGRRKTKLVSAQVLLIKKKLKKKIPQRIIAKEFGVSQSVIRDINRGVTWRFV